MLHHSTRDESRIGYVREATGMNQRRQVTASQWSISECRNKCLSRKENSQDDAGNKRKNWRRDSYYSSRHWMQRSSRQAEVCERKSVHRTIFIHGAI